MKVKKISAVLAVCLCSAMLLTGCSFSDFFDKVLGNVSEPETSSSSSSSKQESAEVKTVDPTLELPAFTVDLTGTTQVTAGSVCTLSAPAAVSDGGTVTYQWYKNNVNSNGGGTIIAGAEEESYDVDTSEAGTTYYYAVATNNHGDRIAKSTSAVREITVWPLGTWQQDEVGFKYVMEDGTYPADMWIDIEGFTYHVDSEGHRAVGWYQEGDYMFYFNEGGELQRNTTTPDGHTVNENGVMIS